MPRMSEKLSSRAIQPGTNNTGIESEKCMLNVLYWLLPESEWKVVEHPNELRHLFGDYGICPDVSIEHLNSGKRMYFEVKFQGSGGNAEERACKLFTTQFKKTAKKIGFAYHPFKVVFTGALATDKKYLTKFPYFYEDNEYILWKDINNALQIYDPLCNTISNDMKINVIPQNPEKAGYPYNPKAIYY